MVKYIVLLKRKEGLSREDFARHWHDVHGRQLALAQPGLRYIRRYVQNHAFADRDDVPTHLGLATRHDSFDGVTEVWFDSVEDVRRLADENRVFYRDVLAPDEERFLDRDRCATFVCVERVVVDDGRAAGA